MSGPCPHSRHGLGLFSLAESNRNWLLGLIHERRNRKDSTESRSKNNQDIWPFLGKIDKQYCWKENHTVKCVWKSGEFENWSLSSLDKNDAGVIGQRWRKTNEAAKWAVTAAFQKYSACCLLTWFPTTDRRNCIDYPGWISWVIVEIRAAIPGRYLNLGSADARNGQLCPHTRNLGDTFLFIVPFVIH